MADISIRNATEKSKLNYENNAVQGYTQVHTYTGGLERVK